MEWIATEYRFRDYVISYCPQTQVWDLYTVAARPGEGLRGKFKTAEAAKEFVESAAVTVGS